MSGTRRGVLAAIILILCLTGCAMHRYQVCVASQTGEIGCLAPQDHHGAELKALVVNATAQGAAVAWVQSAQPKTKSKPAKDSVGDSVIQ